VFATEGGELSELVECLDVFQPDILHVHHAFRAGSLLFDGRVRPHIRDLPVVVSPGGTDINLDAGRDDRREIVAGAFRRARLILTQSNEVTTRLLELFPDLRDRITSVPKGFSWLGDEPYDLRSIMGCRPENILFFLPAGIRPIKGNLECLSAMEGVFRVRPSVRMVFAGPALDPDYAVTFEKRINGLSRFARWIPSIPFEAIRSAYAGADVVLNTSFAEGLPNALLEAIASGKPVLASNIPGNHWPVLGEDGSERAGILFEPDDREDFIRKALELIDDAGLRHRLGRAGLKRAALELSHEKEAEGLVAAYKVALGLTDGRTLSSSKSVEPPPGLTVYRSEGETYQKLHLCGDLRDLPEWAGDQPVDPNIKKDKV
jgi:glycosyltransferase involved in cell wall biosynthesis